ncbi:hypothetical protein CPC08DRAFT_468037 [Agrocybe pediades]|nr:hypothetical protein CPC08DRAFT_468037 [Agrocybe pediades]
MSSPSLLSLPPEIIQHTAFLLLASSPPALPSLGHTSSSPSSTGPLGPPSQLLPLFLTHRSLHATLTQPAFLAKVLRLKFDVGAVERRRQGERTMENSNTLTPEEMERMLICWCDCLTFIRAFVTKLFSISAAAREGGGGVVPQTAELTLTGDELQHVYAHMFTCFLMMLDNEGKNYAQLKHAGVHTFVDWFIRKCIWDPSLPYLSPAALQKLEEENDGASPLPSAYGWPIDTPHTSAAFLLYWLVLERPMLYNMPFVEKEEIIRVILPFVVMPFRYPTTEAPVNHFNLPLDVRKEKGNDDDEAIPTQQDPLSFYLPAYARAASVGQAQEDGTTTAGGGISLEERREQEKEHGMPLAYPIYTPPYSRCLTVPYSTVNSIWANSPDGLARNPRKVTVQLVSLPPASMGAKMLFVAMREARPVVIPPVLPPGMSRRDYAIIGADVESDEEQEQDGQEGAEEEEEGAAREARRRRRMRTWRKKYLDRGKSARLPRGAEWDWDRGMAVAVNPRWTPDGPRAVRRPSSSTPPSTKEEEEEHLAIELEWENDNLIKPGDEESKNKRGRRC